MSIILYSLLLLFLSVYSYVLVDPNMTLFNSKYWEIFRNAAVNIGYYQRDLSTIFYFVILILLFLFHYFFLKKYNNFNPLKMSLLIGLILLISYPFLSHDFFNYLFDGKIIAYYHQNPYFFKALDFPEDSWLRFMHWTHRTYPYGPIFLLISMVPSFLAMGKFILYFLFFKITFFTFYILAVYLLQKINRTGALLFATHPLIIIEGLVNSHNDIVAVSLGIVGTYFLLTKKEILGRITLLFSAGIKYISFPLILLSRQKRSSTNLIVFLFLGLTLIYLILNYEIQPWYFLVLFTLIPFNEKLITSFNVFLGGLLLSYYPYIRFGGWDSVDKIQFKHIIILVCFLVNVVLLARKIIVARKLTI